MREIDAYHKMDSLYNMNYFFCFRKNHGYNCEQPFDFCPSCGDAMKKTLDQLIEQDITEEIENLKRIVK